MDNLKSIISYQTAEYGQIRIKLADVLNSRRIYLRTLTGAKYDVITRYFKGEQIERVDLDFLARVCYVLDCKIEDLLEYTAPENSENQS